MAQVVSDKRAARARVYDLVSAENQKKTLKNAYKLKAEFLKEQREAAASDPRPDHCLIRTLDPLIVPPEGKFGHCQGAHISPPPQHRGLHKTLVR